MKAQIIDEYFTGNYAAVGNLPDSIEVESLPNETDLTRLQCYKRKDGEWIFDEQRHAELSAQAAIKDLEIFKQQMTAQSKSNLAEYINSYKLKSSCHGGTEKEYSITTEKQSYLFSMIIMTQMAEQSGIPYQPSWNASGEPCTYDWTLAELQQLAMEIEAVVRPLVLAQQQMEVVIMEAETLEELQNIDVTF